MQPVVPLVKVLHGSHLYGTNTETSDTDYKGVHLPSGRAILLQKAEDVIDTSAVAKDEHGKNQSESIDSQSFSLQQFYAMLAKGDTVATEILFAEPLRAHPDWPHYYAVGRTLLNRDCKGFVGYCQRQAAKYGIKGSRMNAVKKVVDLLNVEFQQHKGERLGYIMDLLQKLSEGEEHMQWENIPHPDGRDCWHFVCCDRKMPMTASLVEAYNVYNTVWTNYGERARKAAENDGIDWKAVSHAVRVARQAIELLTTGKLTFPRPDAAELLAIKQGKRPYSEVSVLLEGLVQQVQSLESTVLPAVGDVEGAREVVVQAYLGQVR